MVGVGVGRVICSSYLAALPPLVSSLESYGAGGWPLRGRMWAANGNEGAVPVFLDTPIRQNPTGRRQTVTLPVTEVALATPNGSAYHGTGNEASRCAVIRTSRRRSEPTAQSTPRRPPHLPSPSARAPAIPPLVSSGAGQQSPSAATLPQVSHPARRSALLPDAASYEGFKRRVHSAPHARESRALLRLLRHERERLEAATGASGASAQRPGGGANTFHEALFANLFASVQGRTESILRLYEEYEDGKSAVMGAYLVIVDQEVDAYLARRFNFVGNALPADYLDVQPTNMDQIRVNLRAIQRCLASDLAAHRLSESTLLLTLVPRIWVHFLLPLERSTTQLCRMMWDLLHSIRSDGTLQQAVEVLEAMLTHWDASCEGPPPAPGGTAVYSGQERQWQPRAPTPPACLEQSRVLLRKLKRAKDGLFSSLEYLHVIKKVDLCTLQGAPSPITASNTYWSSGDDDDGDAARGGLYHHRGPVERRPIVPSDYIAVSGLVLSRLHRLENEYRTVWEHWNRDQTARSPSNTPSPQGNGRRHNGSGQRRKTPVHSSAGMKRALTSAADAAKAGLSKLLKIGKQLEERGSFHGVPSPSTHHGLGRGYPM